MCSSCLSGACSKVTRAHILRHGAIATAVLGALFTYHYWVTAENLLRGDEEFVFEDVISESNTVRHFNESGARYVFLFGYKRGGTTLLYSVLNQDQRVAAWYEPLSPLYGTLYGLPNYRPHEQIVFSNKEFRNLTQYEIEQVTKYLVDMFTCNLDKLPTEILSNSFLKWNSLTKQYFACYKENPNSMQERNCMDTDFKHHCGFSVRSSSKSKCDLLSKCTRNYVQSHKSKGDRNTKDLTDHCQVETDVRMDVKIARAFLNRQLCIERIGSVVQKCMDLTHLQERCHETKIRTAKILRLKMPFVEPLIKSLPEIKIVHYFRDPRAIAKSRCSKRHKIDPDRWRKMTLQLCKEMSRDITAASQISKIYPKVIRRLRYEDLVLTPDKALIDLYGVFEEKYSPEVLKWLKGTMNADNDDNAYHVKRSNGTEHVEDWRRLVPVEDVKFVSNDSACKRVLKELNYSA